MQPLETPELGGAAAAVPEVNPLVAGAAGIGLRKPVPKPVESVENFWARGRGHGCYRRP